MTHESAESQPRLALVGDDLTYSSPNGSQWKLSLDQIAIVGEYTNAAGPYVDDYFLVLVTKSGEQHWASFYSDNRDTVLSELGRAFDTVLDCALCNSTDLKSRIMWPPDLADSPLFTFVPVKPTTLRQRLKERILPTVTLHLTDAARDLLRDLGNAV